MSYLPNRALLLASALLSLVVLGALAACAAPAPPPTPAPTLAPPTATPLPRGGELRIRLDADIPNLRPWQPRSRGEEQAIGLIYSGLARLDARLAPQPDLASGWEYSADGRLITVTLRPGLTWHDGAPLTADDAAYTIQSLKAISPTTALLSGLRRVAEASAPTSTTLVISLTERYAPIFSLLATPVLPKHLLIDKEIAELDFWSVPVGSGPFQVAERIPGERVVLRGFAQFHRGAPLLDAVAMVVLREPEQAAAALADGRIQLAELPWAAARALPAGALQQGAYPENGYYFMAMNGRPGRPLADPRVREALAATVDLPALVELATAGQGIPIASSAAPGSWADQTAVPTATLDLARARRLLDEAGWKAQAGSATRQQGGAPLALRLFVRGDDPRRVAAAEQIARGAAQAGIAIELQRVDFEQGIRPRYAPPYDFDLLIGSWSNGIGDPSFADYAYYDPDDFALFHSSQINQGLTDTRPSLNIVGFSDATYDERATAARQIYSPAERAQAIGEAQARVAQLRPYLFLWADRIPVALAAGVTIPGGSPALSSPMYLWDIERWYLAR